MQEEHLHFTASDGTIIAYYRFSVANPRYVVQIAHGMAEHCGGYRAFAMFLGQENIAVYANDHRGHGITGRINQSTGYFCRRGGATKVVEDAYSLTKIIKQDYPDTPLVFIGHSMGSFIGAVYASKYNPDIDSLILTGTTLVPFLSRLMVFLSWCQVVVGKGNEPHKFIDFLMRTLFGSSKPLDTDMAWLTSDKEQLNLFLQDPLRLRFSPALLYKDIGLLLTQSTNLSTLKKMRKDLPVLLISGSEDIISHGAKDVKKLAKRYKKAGVKGVSCKVYPHCRHGILWEKNKNEVYKDLLTFIETKSI